MNEAGVPASGVRIDATGHVDLTDVAKGTDVTSEAFRDALARCGPGLAAAGLLSLVGNEERTALDSVFGEQLLQIGDWGGEPFFRLARTRRAALVAGG